MADSSAANFWNDSDCAKGSGAVDSASGSNSACGREVSRRLELGLRRGGAIERGRLFVGRRSADRREALFERGAAFSSAILTLSRSGPASAGLEPP